MDREQVIATLRANEAKLRQQGVAHAAVFGSVARGEARPDSDIDILVDLDLEAKLGLFQYVAMTQFLESLFPLRIDVAESGALSSMCGRRLSATRFMPFDRAIQPLADIREHILLAQSFLDGLSVVEFLADRRTVLAVTRCLEVIPEAARRLPVEIQNRHLDLPWHAIRSAGDIYRHEYRNVDDQMPWYTVRNDCAALLRAVEQELALIAPGEPHDV